MADAVTSQTIVDGDRYAVIKLAMLAMGLVNPVTKVDVSSLASLGSNTADQKACTGHLSKRYGGSALA